MRIHTSKAKHRSSKKTLKNKFTRKDFNSSHGMLTTVWGPPLWHFLHLMSFNYPTNPTCEEKQKYKSFMHSLKDVLPCGACRKNLTYNLKKRPITPHLKNRITFSKYIYQLHETINKYLNKKSGLTYNQVKIRYEHFRAKCNTPSLKKHIGCAKAFRSKKTKTIINIVPNTTRCKTLKIDKKCFA
tara:strand:- start:613 stop:1167 length:555 start_codon:yes stop_codon:yes gene_type:complete